MLTSCSGWAKQGECDGGLKDFMSKYCCKSCEGGVKICNDDNQSCSRWAQYGFCSGQYASYMMSNCRKSCNNC